jgi:hypothetical protein
MLGLSKPGQPSLLPRTTGDEHQPRRYHHNRWRFHGFPIPEAFWSAPSPHIVRGKWCQPEGDSMIRSVPDECPLESRHRLQALIVSTRRNGCKDFPLKNVAGSRPIAARPDRTAASSSLSPEIRPPGAARPPGDGFRTRLVGADDLTRGTGRARVGDLL